MLDLAELETPVCDCGQPCEPDQDACWQCLSECGQDAPVARENASSANV